MGITRTVVSWWAACVAIVAGACGRLFVLVWGPKLRRLGAYDLLERIGQGGMGEVWLGWDSALNRPAAVKIVRPDLLDTDPELRAETLRRFAREVRAMAALRSPHTVRVYDHDINQRRPVYYAMELLDGESLEELGKREGPLPVLRTIELLRQICESLGEAHDRGLVHCDIKPTNIFVCRGPAGDFVKVLDFGLVRQVRGPAETTQTGLRTRVAGTPGYMAPEVALGQPNIDRRSDIYAVGCLAYWLLTGHLVFDAGSPIAEALAHVSKVPVPPSARGAAGLPLALDDLIMRCLAKSPAERPQSVAELARRLSRITASESGSFEERRCYARGGRAISRSSHSLAASQSRETVSADTSRIAAIS